MGRVVSTNFEFYLIHYYLVSAFSNENYVFSLHTFSSTWTGIFYFINVLIINWRKNLKTEKLENMYMYT